MEGEAMNVGGYDLVYRTAPGVAVHELAFAAALQRWPRFVVKNDDDRPPFSPLDAAGHWVVPAGKEYFIHRDPESCARWDEEGNSGELNGTMVYVIDESPSFVSLMASTREDESAALAREIGTKLEATSSALLFQRAAAGNYDFAMLVPPDFHFRKALFSVVEKWWPGCGLQDEAHPAPAALRTPAGSFRRPHNAVYLIRHASDPMAIHAAGGDARLAGTALLVAEPMNAGEPIKFAWINEPVSCQELAKAARTTLIDISRIPSAMASQQMEARFHVAA
jgi:hypothetical protein